MKLLKFWAQWCSPCKQQTLLLKDFTDVEVVSVGIEEEENADLVDQYRVRNLPTMVLVDEQGNELKRFTGLTQPEKITEALEQLT